METKTALMGERTTYLTEHRVADRVLTDVLLIEADAIRSVIDTTRESFAEEVDLISDSNRPLIVAGVGMSWLIEKTIVSAFRFLRKRAAFLHAAGGSIRRAAQQCLPNLPPQMALHLC